MSSVSGRNPEQANTTFGDAQGAAAPGNNRAAAESAAPLDNVLTAGPAPATAGQSFCRLAERLPLDQALLAWLKPAGRTRGDAELKLLIDRAMAEIDQALSRQINAILHHPRFQQIEASWRGLWYLVDQTAAELERADEHERGPESALVQLRLLNVTWRELARDAERAIEFDQTALFRKVYEDEFGMPGGKPYGLLLGDYQMRHRLGEGYRIDDVSALTAVAGVAAAAFAPFIASVHPALFGLQRFDELGPHLHLSADMRSNEYLAWRSLRSHDDAKFVGLTIPRLLMRRPYRDDAAPGEPTRVDGFCFREDVEGLDASKYLWGSAAYALAAVMVRSFVACRWFADIRGAARETDPWALAAGRNVALGGGVVASPAIDSFTTDAPGVANKMPTEVFVGDRLEAELTKQGLIPLAACQDTEFSVFYTCPSLHKPKEYTDPAATASAQLSAMLQYTMCVSRIAHYVKVIARDKVGGTLGKEELQRTLSDWLAGYVAVNASAEDMARKPLREAAVTVHEIPGKPGSYRSVIHLAPQFQLDSLAASIRLTTELTPSETR